ncbi:MAG: apolipoprotein N-acyltransferase [Opitutae bacterium]|nr:apolipoprotein N-acyltransferase [Opitutae bacterium]
MKNIFTEGLKVIWAPLISSMGTYFFLLLAQPPRQSPECAYFFLMPAIFWFSFKPKLKIVALAFFLAGILYHLSLVGWMRHISFSGMLMACVLLSLYYLPWFLLARVLIPKAIEGGFRHRFLILIILPSAWVSVEWLRCQFTLGFPWCPLSVTQWERPVLLQTAQWLGAWGISFFLVFLNLSLCSYLHHLLVRRQNSKGGIFGNICPDFYLAILLFVFMLSPFFLFRSYSPIGVQEYKVGLCQPYLLEKWKGGNADLHKDILTRQTHFLGLMNPDFIVWPEASTPYALNKDTAWVEQLADETQTPLLIGAVLKDADSIYNTISEILPKSGFKNNWYAKRILVPFGEYVPFPFKWIPGLRKLVGPVGSFEKGDESKIFKIPSKKKDRPNLKIGSLICYEDIFPRLCRDKVSSGADLFFVTTNDAWFGREGCAVQHAAHSVLRSIETQKPFIRCGNAGWSGWIDSRGHQRDVLRDDSGSIYFEGAKILNVSIPAHAPGTVSFYMRHGDWFVYLCMGLGFILMLSLKKNLKSWFLV